MDNNNKNNEVLEGQTKGQMCSLFVRELVSVKKPISLAVQNYNLYAVKEKLKAIKLNYPDDNIEATIFKMLSTNNDIVKFFDKDKKEAKKTVELFLNERSSYADFEKGIVDFSHALQNATTPEDIIVSSKRQKSFFVSKENSINEIHKTGILDFYFVKKKLDKNLEQWKVQEAVAWLVCAVENLNYDSQVFLPKGTNGFVDKDKAFDLLVEFVNLSSVTEKEPFVKNNTNSQYAKYGFNDAQSGEIDVMLWDKKTCKIVASSATRDKGVDIEGNQFFRHMLKASSLLGLIKHKFGSKLKKANGNDIKEELIKLRTFLDDGKILTSFKNGNFYGIGKGEVFNKAAEGDSFSEDILIHRSLSRRREMKIGKTFEGFNVNRTYDPKKDPFTISKQEMLAHVNEFQNNIKYVYYGDTEKNKINSDLLAGLNCIAYKDNLKQIGSFKLDDESCDIVLGYIKKRFGDVIHANDVEKNAKNEMMKIISNTNDIKQEISIISSFSKSSLKKDQRECLYSAFSNLYRDISTSLLKAAKEDDVTDRHVKKAIGNGVDMFFKDSITLSDRKKLIDCFAEASSDSPIRPETIMSQIVGNNSEVSKEYHKMNANLDLLYTSKSNLIEKAENNKLKKENDELKAIIENLKQEKSVDNKIDNKIESNKKTEVKSRRFKL